MTILQDGVSSGIRDSAADRWENPSTNGRILGTYSGYSIDVRTDQLMSQRCIRLSA
ncbi:unnamed protein product [Nesidiocoris tenuis]|uniref:Uncharacterized protein n=1 Tax=Nesidiocoris tenuis TaxID=355587 RepID=A0A6H5G416_9HEMI|nr:unnamed protein product [Nesidiocoris tenuis]CAA9997255.1 unnamed protein product [Nesidiocoris tenuis]